MTATVASSEVICHLVLLSASYSIESPLAGISPCTDHTIDAAGKVGEEIAKSIGF